MENPLGERIRALREELGLTQEDLAKKAEITSEFMSMIETGKRTPSLSVLEKLARSLNRDVSSLLAEERPVFTLLLRAEGLGEAERRDLARFVHLCENYSFLEGLVATAPTLAPTYPGPSPLQIKSYKEMERYAEQLAEAERKRIGLGDEPIKDIFLLLEQQGVHPIRLGLGADSKLAGAFVFNTKVGAFFLINASQVRSRQVFTAAHEYCHFLKDRAEGVILEEGAWIGEPAVNGRSPKETIANIFAANFLMPASAVARVVSGLTSIGPEEVLYLKRYFGVSYLAMVCRLQGLGWIKKDRADRLKALSPTELERQFFKQEFEEEAEAPEEIPTRMFQLAVHAYREGHITLSRLAELLNRSAPEMRRLLVGSGMDAPERGTVEKGSR